MKSMHSTAAVFVAAIGLFLVALLDLVTGTELRIFPLYFLPLAFIAWHFGRAWSIAASFLASSLWVATLFMGGRMYSEPYIWVINFCTQTFAFIIISFLVAAMRAAYKREKATGRVDPLTELPNRRGFEEQAEHILALCQRHGWPLTLAYVDLDNFKTVNDTRGHDAGDQVLQKAAATFRERLRHSDLVGRIGGDEFVVLLPETDGDMAEHILQTLRRSLAAEPEFAASAITASIGASAFHSPPTSLASLIRSADEVMYGVKAAGKNHVQVEVRG